jgi:cytochrome c556
MKRIILAGVAILFGIGAVAAQQDLVNQSKTLMKSNGKNLGGVLSPMVKGEKPYDQAAVDAALDLGKQERFRGQDRKLCQGRDGSQGQGQGPRYVEDNPADHRQGMLQLP